MNYRCWRKGNIREDENSETTWPKLPNPTIEEKWQTRGILRTRVSSQLHIDLDACSEEIESLETLDEYEFPKLGETVGKKKQTTISNRQQLSTVDNFIQRAERRLRIPRSTDLIHVDLQKMLEMQKWPIALLSNPREKRTVDICKLNVNMNVASPIAKWLITKSKRKTIYIGKKKKLSKLKGLILYERMLRKQSFMETSDIPKVSFDSSSKEDTCGINLENLQINFVPPNDPELSKKMSALSFFTTNYRDSCEINITEENVIFRPDLHEKMKKMSIEANDDDSMLPTDGNNVSSIGNEEFIDTAMTKATENLKICDETREMINNICIKDEPIEKIRFTKNFREYCTNTVNENLRIHLDDFLSEISRLQKKMYERDNVKGKSKRRYYAGFKEVQKHIELKKIKFVVIATDLEKIEIEGGLDDTLNKFVQTCKRHEVSHCFGLGRRKLGYYTHGRGFVSCIGIANYSGTEEKLKKVFQEVVEARNNFSRLMHDEAKIINVEKFLIQDDLLLSEIINAYLKILASPS